MTLGQFATAVNATPRWVLNALARLGHKRAYSEPLARRLALARYLAEGVGMPLTEAWEVARDVLALPMTGVWRRESLGGVTLTIELGRFYTTYGAHLSLANTCPAQAVTLTVTLAGLAPQSVTGRILTAPAMNAHNTFAAPNAVQPTAFDGASLKGGTLEVKLPAKSVVVLALN